MSKLDQMLWDAMLTVFPAIVVQDLKMAPKGCAQLVREHAQALVDEWMQTGPSAVSPGGRARRPRRAQEQAEEAAQ